MKMTFLLFCVIILNDTRFFSTSFVVHCCLVWCVGVPQSFFTVHNECGTKNLAPLGKKLTRGRSRPDNYLVHTRGLRVYEMILIFDKLHKLYYSHGAVHVDSPVLSE